MMALPPSGNETLYLFKLLYEPSHLFLKLKDDSVSFNFIGLFKWNALRMRGVPLISYSRVRNEGVGWNKEPWVRGWPWGVHGCLGVNKRSDHGGKWLPWTMGAAMVKPWWHLST